MFGKHCFLVVAALAFAFPSNGTAQSKAPTKSKPSMVGTWRLVAVHSWTGKDKKEMNREAYGPHPGGLITYTADGRMSVIETYDERKPLSADREAAPMEERAQAFSTMVAYAGSYTFQGDRVIHHVEVSASPGPARDQVRYVTFQGPDRVSLRTPLLMRNGVAEIHEMFWVRVK
jgi:Lipocalin-like domain